MAKLAEQISVEKEALKKCLFTEMDKNAADFESLFLNLIFVSVALYSFSVFLYFTSRSPDNYGIMEVSFWAQLGAWILVSGGFIHAIKAGRYPEQWHLDFDKHFSDLYVHVC